MIVRSSIYVRECIWWPGIYINDHSDDARKPKRRGDAKRRQDKGIPDTFFIHAADVCIRCHYDKMPDLYSCIYAHRDAMREFGGSNHRSACP